ncbi:MAG: phosphoserine aminotransferase, partial [Methylocystis sp.]
SNTAVCLKFSSFSRFETDAQRRDCAKRMLEMIEAEGAGYDLGASRSAPPGFRIWCGATVESANVAALLPWLDWAYNHAVAD